ncbi:MAG TPA: VanZ family protein [Phenylobacterium sp.]|nr:VanZ family protein [Phenylobacterium sp.]
MPHAVRLAAYSLAVAVLLYLTLAPAQDLPKERLWDKAEHAIAWSVLAGVGLAFWPERPRLISGFAFGLGALIEVLQWAMPFGRDGDVRDLLADSVGIAVALLAWSVVRRVAVRRPVEV